MRKNFYRALWALCFWLTQPVFAADSTTPSTNNGVQGAGILGAGTYIPNNGASNTNTPSANPASRTAAPAAPVQIQVPTPDTIPAPTVEIKSNGRWRNARQEVRIDQMLLDRYKHSVVRVSAKDLAGNVLAKALGVGIGKNAQYIAAPLSLVLGTSQQWADRIEVAHFAGNKYFAQVALIDEEKNLVLLMPEASPAAVPFVREVDERPQIDVFTISYETDSAGNPAPAIHRGRLAAVNAETGVFSVSAYPGQVIDDSQAGSAVIDSSGSLVGMLLPGGRGVLSSTLQRVIAKAQKAVPLEPRMIGVILGRGVLVDPKLEGAYKTITAALDAIKKGEAPKTDPTRYIPARNRAVAPKDTDKVVVKVMPGTYVEPKTILIGSDLSLSGSGPANTIIIGTDPQKPVILVQNSENNMISGFRIVPAKQQDLKAPTVIFHKAKRSTLLGNVIEAKGGVGLWVHDSHAVALYGNTFANGTSRALSCDNSDLEVQANAFVGAWPIAVSLEKKCTASLLRNLFLDNKNSVSVSSFASSVSILQNTFLRSPSAVRLTGAAPRFLLSDNLFYECTNALFSGDDVKKTSLGRNATWRSKFFARARPLFDLDIVRTEPVFEAAENYDFRLKAGKGQTGAALRDLGGDLGAFQRTDLLGPYTGQLARSLGSAIGVENLAKTWGLSE